MTKRSRLAGLFLPQTTDLTQGLSFARNGGFTFICVGHLLHDEYVKNVLATGDDSSPKLPFAWFDLQLPTNDWTTSFIGVLRDLNQQLESDDPQLAERAKRVVTREIEFAHHIGLTAIVVELKDSCVNLARIIQSSIVSGHGNQVFWVKIPMTLEKKVLEKKEANGGVEEEDSSWKIWHKFRTSCNFENRVTLGLVLPADVPDEEEIKRWLGEPVQSIFIPKKCFLSNRSGYPTLNAHHKRIVRQFLELGAHAVFDPEALDISDHVELSKYVQYIQYLQSADGNELGDDYGGIQYTSGFEDYLQCPLQPLQDNLESNTYEVFEKDPIKYELYRQAVYNALLDMVPDCEKETKTIVLMVVGSGRGPIVRSSFRAAEEANRKIRVYAIEKNRNAANTLLHLNEKEWRGKVTVVNVDMREWDAPEKADIIVSELLGSFGDNELSPECLDGAQKFLKPSGIMIPQSYRSYIAPIMSSKLYNDARNMRDGHKHIVSHLETPYVVHMKNRYQISDPQKAFTFCHPKKEKADTNDRYISLSFRAKEDCVMHGFAGYFESTLYGNVLMSILPETFSKGMFSWFPIYFPVREPINIEKGKEIKAHFWRCSSKISVWYEWNISSPVAIPIHNSHGRSYTIGL